jgi:hypothetical protein
METTPATEMGIEPLVERVARAMAADQSKRLYGIDRGQDEAWEANTDYGRTELLADARAAIAAYEATRTPEAAQGDIAARFLAWTRPRSGRCRSNIGALNGENGSSRTQGEWRRCRDRRSSRDALRR